MINELGDKICFNATEATFKKYFFNKKENAHEKQKKDELTKMLFDFYGKEFEDPTDKKYYDFFDYDFAGYNYLDNYGYYKIIHDYSSYYFVINFGEDINRAFRSINRNIIDKKSMRYEKENRRSLKKEFKEHYPKKPYMPEMSRLKYSFDKWRDYYDGELPEEVLDAYRNTLKYLSLELEDNIDWIYNADSKTETKVKRLKK